MLPWSLTEGQEIKREPELWGGKNVASESLSNLLLLSAPLSLVFSFGDLVAPLSLAFGLDDLGDLIS